MGTVGCYIIDRSQIHRSMTQNLGCICSKWHTKSSLIVKISPNREVVASHCPTYIRLHYSVVAVKRNQTFLRLWGLKAYSLFCHCNDGAFTAAEAEFIDHSFKGQLAERSCSLSGMTVHGMLCDGRVGATW